jgi:hypothetical protein
MLTFNDIGLIVSESFDMTEFIANHGEELQLKHLNTFEHDECFNLSHRMFSTLEEIHLNYLSVENLKDIAQMTSLKILEICRYDDEAYYDFSTLPASLTALFMPIYGSEPFECSLIEHLKNLKEIGLSSEGDNDNSSFTIFNGDKFPHLEILEIEGFSWVYINVTKPFNKLKKMVIAEYLEITGDVTRKMFPVLKSYKHFK